MTRGRILLGWDLGDGLGHVRRLIAAARALRSEGWSPILALRNIHRLPEETKAVAEAVVLSPQPRVLTRPGEAFSAASFADIVAVSGFADPAAMRPVLAVWDGLMALARPVAAIADFSPSLALACRGRVPLVAIGDGFVLPPVELPRFPVLRENARPFAPDGRVEEVVAALLRERAAPPLDTLPALVGGDAQIVCTFPALDIYGAHRHQAALGPFEPPPPAAPLPAPSIFAYLAADYVPTATMLDVLAQVKLPVACYVRDLDAARRERLASAGVRVHDRPPPLGEALSRASAIIHHGGIGTTEAALAMGRPQLLMPRHLEQYCTARRLAEIGAGIALPYRSPAPEMRGAIIHLMSTPGMKIAAADAAQAVATWQAGRALDALVETVDRLAVA
jgi:hypothetical protein